MMEVIRSDSRGVALVAGVGARRGLGGAIAHRFARAGHPVVVAGRTAEKLEPLVKSIEAEGGRATHYLADVTDEASVRGLFDAAEAEGALEVVVYNAGNNRWSSILDMSAELFEQMWRVCCFGGFLVGREAGRRMVDAGRGSILFTGASASLRGRASFAAFASAKAGLRMVAQSMARELGPRGLHVAHVVVDGVVDGDMIRGRLPGIEERFGEQGMLDVDAVADAFFTLHRQDPTAWTHELDLRPFKESW